MEAQVWTLIGILVSLVIGLGVLFFTGYQHLSAKIDSQGTELRVAIASQGAELRVAIEGLGERLASHLERHTG